MNDNFEKNSLEKLEISRNSFLRQSMYTMAEFAAILAVPAAAGFLIGKYTGHVVLSLVVAFVLSWIYIIRRILKISAEWNYLDEQIKQVKESEKETPTFPHESGENQDVSKE